LRFGRFLTFLESNTTVLKSEIATSKLTERRFRNYWGGGVGRQSCRII